MQRIAIPFDGNTSSNAFATILVAKRMHIRSVQFNFRDPDSFTNTGGKVQLTTSPNFTNPLDPFGADPNVIAAVDYSIHASNTATQAFYGVCGATQLVPADFNVEPGQTLCLCANGTWAAKGQVTIFAD